MTTQQEVMERKAQAYATLTERGLLLVQMEKRDPVFAGVYFESIKDEMMQLWVDAFCKLEHAGEPIKLAMVWDGTQIIVGVAAEDGHKLMADNIHPLA